MYVGIVAIINRSSMRLDKYLCDMQIGTRSQVKEFIKKGFISVNNTIVKKPEIKVDEEKDLVCYMGKRLFYQKQYYYMLHKPAGYVTATMDNQELTVMTLLIGAAGKGLFPVGRLDKDTEGLLLITNDGELAHNLLSPGKHVEKTYYVECLGEITDSDVEHLECGVDIGDATITLPAKVNCLSRSEGFSSMQLTITEGRFHQIKRMIQAVGSSVIYLKRLSMGTLYLDSTLPKGAYRPLTEPEVMELKLPK